MDMFNISKEDAERIDTWSSIVSAPALFLHIPEHGNVGESELVAYLAGRVYEKNVGLGMHRRDSRQRHFASRNFPYGGGEADYIRFRDELEDSAEVSNDFYGIDNVDLTTWVGKDPSKGCWDALVHHVQEHPTVDFVFSARSAEDGQASKLADLVRTTCGVPVEEVALLPPTPEMLARSTFADAESAPGYDRLVAWYRDLGDAGVELNYALARSLSAKARVLGVDLADAEEAERFITDYGKTAAGLYEKKKLGF